jgi:hypothetical protein
VDRIERRESAGRASSVSLPLERASAGLVGGWINAKTKKLVDVRPTHWRAWQRKI